MRPHFAAIAAGLMLAIAGQAVAAVPFAKRPDASDDAAARIATQVEQAIAEERYLDANKLLSQAALTGVKSPRLNLLAAEISLARGRYADALDGFRKAVDTPELRKRALQGQGLALALLKRSNEALPALQSAVAEDPSAWRAWNALGGEYDTRRDWTQAEAAYGKALEHSGGAAAAFNNRGYSRLLQGRYDDAVADLVVALQKKPDLAAARTNLRLALAMRGEYDRALVGGAATDEAALLNNAGFAAMARGDYVRAEELFDRAMKAKGEFYSKASANREMARSLQGRKPGEAKQPDGN